MNIELNQFVHLKWTADSFIVKDIPLKNNFGKSKLLLDLINALTVSGSFISIKFRFFS